MNGYLKKMAVWPSGLRRQVKVLVSSEAWVRTPQLSQLFFLKAVVFEGYFLSTLIKIDEMSIDLSLVQKTHDSSRL